MTRATRHFGWVWPKDQEEADRRARLPVEDWDYFPPELWRSSRRQNDTRKIATYQEWREATKDRWP